MSTYQYLSLEDSQSQLDRDLREAGPSKRNATVFSKYSKKDHNPESSISFVAVSLSEPNLPVPEPEPEKRPELEPEPEKRPEFPVPEVT